MQFGGAGAVYAALMTEDGVAIQNNANATSDPAFPSLSSDYYVYAQYTSSVEALALYSHKAGRYRVSSCNASNPARDTSMTVVEKECAAGELIAGRTSGRGGFYVYVQKIG